VCVHKDPILKVISLALPISNITSQCQHSGNVLTVHSSSEVRIPVHFEQCENCHGL
jgi:hypothetical protein